MRSLRALLTILITLSAAATVRAELVWNPATGWSIEGGALSGLVGADARNALELMNRAREAEDKGNLSSALRQYSRISKNYPNSIYSPEAYFRSAHIRLERKQYYKAFESYQQIMSRYPNTERFNDVLAEQYKIASALLNGARNHAFGFIPTFRSKERAISYFEWIVQNAPYSDYAPLALMNVARTYQKLNNTTGAIITLDRLISNYPQNLLAPDAYIQLAQTHASLVDGPNYDQEATKEAITYFEDFMILFPEDGNLATAQTGLDDMRTVLAESKMRIADYYMDKSHNPKGARVFYNEAITTYPDSAVAVRARERLDRLDAIEAANEASSSGQNTADNGGRRKKFLGIF